MFYSLGVTELQLNNLSFTVIHFFFWHTKNSNGHFRKIVKKKISPNTIYHIEIQRYLRCLHIKCFPKKEF